MMNYFVSENVFTFNSGTEHAQAKRVQLFTEQGQSAQYVTRNYNRFLARDAEAIGLHAEQVLNMYDFFQGVPTYRVRKFHCACCHRFHWMSTILKATVQTIQRLITLVASWRALTLCQLRSD